MIRLFCLFVLVLFIFPQTAWAQKTRLAAALTDEQVLVTSGFSGAKITIFGAVQLANATPTDIIVLVRGPDRPAWISQKTRFLGLWIGQKRVQFDASPTFFGIASTKPLEKIARADTLRLYEITAQSQQIAHAGNLSSKDIALLKEEYVKHRHKQKLYLEAPNSVRWFENGLFLANIQMPDLTPPGLYTVKTMVFRNGRPVDSTLSTLVVSKIGLGRAIFEFARDHKILHGILGVLMALIAGYVSARTFKRFSH